MTDQQIEQIANPGHSGTRTAMAFQGPDTNVRIGPTPNRVEWIGQPPQVPKGTPLIPPSLSRGAIEMGDLNLQIQQHGLFWVRMKHRNSLGEPTAVVGPWGLGGRPESSLLEFDKEYELPGGAALQLVLQGSAVFLFSGADKAELEFIERAKSMGYVVETPRVKASDRPEFQFMKKKKGFVGSSIEPKPPGFE